MSDIVEIATAHCKEFLSVSSKTHADTAAHAKAWCSFFRAENIIVFTGNTSTTYPTRADAALAIQKILDAFKTFGVGADARPVNVRVEQVTATSALCWLTESFNPPAESGLKRMQFENFYCFTKLPGEERGGFQYMMDDNELQVLGENVPGLLESMG